MTETHASEPRLAVRHVQLVRALFAALAAAMITFSPDHSAAVGLAVFSGFAIATGMMFGIAAWVTYPTGRRAPAVLLAIVTLGAGMATGIGALRTVAMFFVVVIAWAAASGVIEAVAGLRTVRRFRAEADVTRIDPAVAGPASAGDSAPAADRRGPLPARWRPADAAELGPVSAQERSEARDGIVVGTLGAALAVALLLIPAGYRLDYVIAEVGSFALTGDTIAVGVFGGYAAIVAVYLAIAGFSPRRHGTPISAEDPGASAASSPAKSSTGYDTEQSPGGTE